MGDTGGHYNPLRTTVGYWEIWGPVLYWEVLGGGAMGDTRGPLEATGSVLGHWGPPEATGVHWEILGATRRYYGPLRAIRSHWEILGSTRGQQKQLGEPLGGTRDHWGPLVDTRGPLGATRGHWEKHLPQTLSGLFTSRMSGTRKTREIEVLTRSEDPKEKMVDAG